MIECTMRGGKRNGAGAPRGNLNALTSGARSKTVQSAIERALQDPKGRVKVLELVRKYSPSDEVNPVT
jgi:uncharacterized protein YjcR